MRSMWNGALSFSLMMLPVKLGAATESRDVTFRQVHSADGGKIRFQRVCTVCGQEVPYGEVAKGYELPDGEIVVLTDGDMTDLPLATAKTIEVLQFCPTGQVDPMLYKSSYYCWPEGPGARPYALLRQVLRTSGLVAVCRLALRTRETLAVVSVRDDVLLLTTLLWPDEIRVPEVPLPESIAITAEEEQLATQLVAAVTRDFHPEEYTDGYREALLTLVEAKIAGHTPAQPAPPPAAAPGGTLADTLRASLKAQQRPARGSTAARRKPAAGKPAGRKPAKKGNA